MEKSATDRREVLKTGESYILIRIIFSIKGDYIQYMHNVFKYTQFG